MRISVAPVERGSKEKHLQDKLLQKFRKRKQLENKLSQKQLIQDPGLCLELIQSKPSKFSRQLCRNTANTRWDGPTLDICITP